MILQLFVRDNVPADFGKNVYMVCGLIQTDKVLADESIHLFVGDLVDYERRDVSLRSRGNALDSVMNSPIWRKFNNNTGAAEE